MNLIRDIKQIQIIDIDNDGIMKIKYKQEEYRLTENGGLSKPGEMTGFCKSIIVWFTDYKVVYDYLMYKRKLYELK